GLFVLEAVSVIVQGVSFKLTGKRAFRMAPIHHHFEQLGWTEPQIVIRFWIVSVVLALVGLSTLKLRGWSPSRPLPERRSASSGAAARDWQARAPCLRVGRTSSAGTTAPRGSLRRRARAFRAVTCGNSIGRKFPRLCSRPACRSRIRRLTGR